jgi:hypothetical protein
VALVLRCLLGDLPLLPVGLETLVAPRLTPSPLGLEPSLLHRPLFSPSLPHRLLFSSVRGGLTLDFKC